MLRLRIAACLATLPLLVSGCGYFLPSHHYYAVGVARIGDQVHVYAPLCDGERVLEVEAYDNAAEAQASDDDPDPTRFTYWKAADPTEESVAEGWLILGDSRGFKQTPVSAGANIPLPERVGISLRLRVERGEHTVGDVVAVLEAPEYPAGTDRRTVRYSYRRENSKDLRDPQEIRKQSGCAAAYPA
ncbi:hypothetical protein Pen02_82060 [Plantactinospora endophytica]|uniref:DUF2771 domain-containing protein n=1 Tax=Plantactinospora endophytica TaxID=673535 RepID=A0ABQ4EEY4_9ACTN|nr:hypothetical protein Pen02_82060 [Plantactinospora endophytica]